DRIETIDNSLIEKRILIIKEFKSYCGLGRNKAIQLAQDSGSRIKYGRRVLVDRKKFDQWCKENAH
ncbi:MAG: DUF6462 family protein, partial [Clostridiales bacterium]|nr:DUF6462 family protein [Clostridiales bacterium]